MSPLPQATNQAARQIPYALPRLAFETVTPARGLIAALSPLAANVNGRALAREADATRSERCSLEVLWKDLTDGRLRVVDAFCDERRSYLVLGESRRAAEPLSRRDLEFLERTLLGDAGKVVAMENQVSVSTVAVRVAVALRKLGLASRGKPIPPLLTVAAHAARKATTTTEGRSAEFGPPHAPLRVASGPLPRAPTSLTHSERQVLELLVEGHSNAQIAGLRRRSVRTVANQTASIFVKLKVSGRRSLLSHLLRAEPVSLLRYS